MTNRLKNIANGLFWALMILFVAIPTGVRFYGDRIPSFFNWLPVNQISELGFPISLIVFGFILGWFSKHRYDRTAAERTDKIDGCLKIEGVLWQGVANLSRGKLNSVDIDPNPKCPECKTEMRDTSPTGDFSRDSTRWVCKNPNCKYPADTDMLLYDSAESLFTNHFEKITSSKEEPYSLNSLIEDVNGEVTGEKIWREYVNRVSDKQVSVDCFD